MANTTCLIGRQPILNGSGETVAYELLFRDSTQNRANIEGLDTSYVSASVIVSTISHFGVADLLGKRLGFVNMELELIMSEAIEVLPAEQVVIELLETMEPTPELVGRCRRLKELGFCLALDDHQPSPRFEELYGIVDIVKFDLVATPAGSIAEQARALKARGLTLLAEKVETMEEFRACLEIGFDLFQGYFFARPSIIEKKKIDEDFNALFRLMKLMAEDRETEEIETVFATSPGLTYKLLMMVNSAAFSGGNRIKSVRHAMALLGRSHLRQWIQLSLFASRGSGTGLDAALVDLVAGRAALMEQLARLQPELALRPASGEEAFMTGILSFMDTAYDITMAEVADSLSLPDDIAAALTGRSGILGRLLSLAVCLEKMDMDAAAGHLAGLGISEADVLTAQLRSYVWKNSFQPLS